MPFNERKKLYAFVFIGILLFCGLSFIGFAGYDVLTTRTQRATPTLPPPFVLTTPTPLPPTEIVPQCGGPETMYILLVGSDTRGNTYSSGLADAIRILRVDFVNPGVTTLSFPRDLYVEIPEISDHYGITHGKLNQAYLYGNDTFQYYDGPGKGLGLLALTLEHNFGVQVDHSAAINLQTFANVVDALGGIDINLPAEVDGRMAGARSPDLYYPAGEQHLDGYHTMLLARLRPNGDLARNHTQDLILQALAVKLLNPSTLLQIPDIINAFQGSIQTDLGQTEIAQLICLASMIEPQTIKSVNFPEELFGLKRVNDPILGNTSVLDVDFNMLKAYVQEFNNGNWNQ
jgi:LCP family protein required for cell wall assembly